MCVCGGGGGGGLQAFSDRLRLYRPDCVALVGNLENRFYHDAAHIIHTYCCHESGSGHMRNLIRDTCGIWFGTHAESGSGHMESGSGHMRNLVRDTCGIWFGTYAESGSGHMRRERFRDANSGYSCYKSAHAYKCTRVVQSRTFRVINKMATSYGYGWKQTVLGNETRYSLKL